MSDLTLRVLRRHGIAGRPQARLLARSYCEDVPRGDVGGYNLRTARALIHRGLMRFDRASCTYRITYEGVRLVERLVAEEQAEESQTFPYPLVAAPR